jgi:hypothetical protein
VPETQVAIQPPAAVAPVAAAVPAVTALSKGPWWLGLLPLPWLFNGGGGTQPAPCSNGSNADGVCQRTSSTSR